MQTQYQLMITRLIALGKINNTEPAGIRKFDPRQELRYFNVIKMIGATQKIRDLPKVVCQ